MANKTLKAEVLDKYYITVNTGGYQVRSLSCSLCEYKASLNDAPKKNDYGDSNLGKVSRLRGLMRNHLRSSHELKIALLELEKAS